MLCNECAANLRDGILGSPDEFVSCFLAESRIVITCAEWSESHRSKALHDQRSSVFHKLNRSVNVRLTPSATNCFAQAEAQSVED